jgi:hypothetical protein
MNGLKVNNSACQGEYGRNHPSERLDWDVAKALVATHSLPYHVQHTQRHRGSDEILRDIDIS